MLKIMNRFLFNLWFVYFWGYRFSALRNLKGYSNIWIVLWPFLDWIRGLASKFKLQEIKLRGNFGMLVMSILNSMSSLNWILQVKGKSQKQLPVCRNKLCQLKLYINVTLSYLNYWNGDREKINENWVGQWRDDLMIWAWRNLTQIAQERIICKKLLHQWRNYGLWRRTRRRVEIIFCLPL